MSAPVSNVPERRAEVAATHQVCDAHAYVVQQNQFLHSEVARLRSRAERSSRERESAAVELEAAQRARTCLRGLLHNEIEVTRLRGELITTWRTAFERMRGRARRFAAQAALAAAGLVAVEIRHAFADDEAAWCAASGVDVLAAARVAACAAVAIGAVALLACSGEPDTTKVLQQLAAAERGSDALHAVVDEI